MSKPYTWIGDDHPPGWKRVGSIDIADPADVHQANDRGHRIGAAYDGLSGSVAEPCTADVYHEIDGYDYADFSRECRDVRRELRAKILAIGDQELHRLYYRAITLSEHEAARRAIVSRQSESQ